VALRANTSRRRSGGNMKESDLPLVRGGKCGGKLPRGALKWLEEVERFFPGATKDLIIVRQKPISPSARETGIGNATQREKV